MQDLIVKFPLNGLYAEKHIKINTDNNVLSIEAFKRTKIKRTGEKRQYADSFSTWLDPSSYDVSRLVKFINGDMLVVIAPAKGG